jgi:hypothetical protein
VAVRALDRVSGLLAYPVELGPEGLELGLERQDVAHPFQVEPLRS